MATSERILSLAVNEYAWLEDWAKRENGAVSNHIWRFLWGCPEVRPRLRDDGGGGGGDDEDDGPGDVLLADNNDADGPWWWW